MKKILILSSLILFISCKKESIENKGSDVPNQKESRSSLRSQNNMGFTIHTNEYTYVYEGDSLNSFFALRELNSSDQTDTLLGLVHLNISQFNEMFLVEEVTQDYIKLTNDGQSYFIQEMSSSEDFVTFNMYNPASGKQIEVEMFDFIHNLSEIESDFDEDEYIETVCGPCLFFAAATLAALYVDFYCDQQIASGVAGCTESGLCSVVTSCGANCLPCLN